MGTVLVGAVLLALVGWAVFSVRRDRKRGGCAGCSGGCHRGHCESGGEKTTCGGGR